MVDGDPIQGARTARSAGRRLIRMAVAGLAGLGVAWAVDRPERPAANVEPVFVLDGAGFGHGVGMSQWGARGAALKGLDAPAILAHYYPTTTITTTEARDVRVQLVDGAERVTISAAAGVVAIPSGSDLAAPATAKRFDLRVADGKLVVRKGTGTVVADNWTGARFGSTGPVGVDAGQYRGTITVTRTSAGLRVVNTVPLEQYLRSVVSKEMSPAWGDDAPAALRAQAIAARTYALATRRTDGDFDMYDDQRSQVYAGVGAEDRRTDAAVRQTAGQVVTADGTPIVAYYSAASGGRTENVENAFPGAQPRAWLVSVDDPYDDVAPLHRWADLPTFSQAELTKRLGTVVPVTGIVPTTRGASPRVLRARVELAPFGAITLTGAQLRASLDLPDTWFSVTDRRRRPDGAAIPTAGGAPRARVWVAVLNGSGVRGAAAKVAAQAEAAGYVAVAAGNAPTRSGGPVVFYAPGDREAADRLATDLAIGTVAPIAEAGRHAAEAPSGVNLVVILG